MYRFEINKKNCKPWNQHLLSQTLIGKSKTHIDYAENIFLAFIERLVADFDLPKLAFNKRGKGNPQNTLSFLWPLVGGLWQCKVTRKDGEMIIRSIYKGLKGHHLLAVLQLRGYYTLQPERDIMTTSLSTAAITLRYSMPYMVIQYDRAGVPSSDKSNHPLKMKRNIDEQWVLGSNHHPCCASRLQSVNNVNKHASSE